MKRIVSLCVILCISLLPLCAQAEFNLADAVSEAAWGISSKLPKGTKVVVFEMKSDDPSASEMLIEELTYALLQTGSLVVVDRQNLEAIRKELSFQVSGDVSDESAQRLGALLGAETLVSGSFEKRNEKFRFSVKAVKVETAEIQYLSTLMVKDNDETDLLFGISPVSVKPAPAPVPAEPVKPEPVKPAGPTAAQAVGSAVRSVADFTGRFICMSINPVFGIGSYIQGDAAGGGTVVFWELSGAGVLAYGAWMQDNDKKNGDLVFGAGAFMIGGGVVYSLIRPWTYNRAPKVAEALDSVNVGLVSAERVSVSYTVRY